MINFLKNFAKKVFFSIVFVLFAFCIENMLIFSINDFSYYVLPSITVGFLLSMLLPVLYKLARNWELAEQAIKEQEIKSVRKVFFETYPLWTSFFGLIIGIKLLKYFNTIYRILDIDIILESLIGLNYALMISLSLLVNKRYLSESDKQKFEELIAKIN